MQLKDQGLLQLIGLKLMQNIVEDSEYLIDMKNNRLGRRTVITLEVLRKIEQSFLDGGNASDACIIAGISQSTYYDYLAQHQEFSEKIEKIKNSHLMTARRTVVKALATNPRVAMWYLERKAASEFNLGKLVETTEKKTTPLVAIESIQQAYDVLGIKPFDPNEPRPSLEEQAATIEHELEEAERIANGEAEITRG